MIGLWLSPQQYVDWARSQADSGHVKFLILAEEGWSLRPFRPFM